MTNRTPEGYWTKLADRQRAAVFFLTFLTTDPDLLSSGPLPILIGGGAALLLLFLWDHLARALSGTRLLLLPALLGLLTGGYALLPSARFLGTVTVSPLDEVSLFIAGLFTALLGALAGSRALRRSALFLLSGVLLCTLIILLPAVFSTPAEGSSLWVWDSFARQRSLRAALSFGMEGMLLMVLWPPESVKRLKKPFLPLALALSVQTVKATLVTYVLGPALCRILMYPIYDVISIGELGGLSRLEFIYSALILLLSVLKAAVFFSFSAGAIRRTIRPKKNQSAPPEKAAGPAPS